MMRQHVDCFPHKVYTSPWSTNLLKRRAQIPTHTWAWILVIMLCVIWSGKQASLEEDQQDGIWTKWSPVLIVCKVIEIRLHTFSILTLWKRWFSPKSFTECNKDFMSVVAYFEAFTSSIQPSAQNEQKILKLKTLKCSSWRAEKFNDWGKRTLKSHGVKSLKLRKQFCDNIKKGQNQNHGNKGVCFHREILMISPRWHSH